MPDEPVVGAEAVNALLREWRAELKGGADRPAETAPDHRGDRMTSTADTPSSGPSRGRIIAARALVVLGVVLVVVSLLSNWVKREALDPDTFRRHRRS